MCVFFSFKMWVYVLQLWDYFTIQTCFSQFWEHKKVWVVRRKLEFWRKTNLNFVIYKLIIQIKGFWLQIKGFWLFPLNSVFTSHNNIFFCFHKKIEKINHKFLSRNSDFFFVIASWNQIFFFSELWVCIVQLCNYISQFLFFRIWGRKSEL